MHQRNDMRDGGPAATAAKGMRAHTVTAFDEDLAAISARIARLGGMAEELVSLALRALETADAALAVEAAARRDLLAASERALAEQAAVVLARRQPMASDLRQVLGALRVAAALRRIGELAANIAGRAAVLGRARGASGLDLDAAVARFGARARAQLDQALCAHQARDAEAALAVWRRDNDLDAHFDSLEASLLQRMTESRGEVARGAQWLFVTKNLERIGDQARRIAAAAWWMARGEEIDAAGKGGEAA